MMMQDRWRSTRTRIHQETDGGDPNALWIRIAASRSAGRSVLLQVADPRRPASPVLVGLLAVVVFAGLRLSRAGVATAPPDSVAMAAADQEALEAIEWLITPLYAQGVGLSDLPKIDPPDLTRITAQALVYRFTGGADGQTTEQYGTDTLRIARDMLGSNQRVVVSYNSMPRKQATPINLSYSGVDSLALSAEGRFLFLKSSYSRNDRPQVLLQRDVLLSPDSITFVGFSKRLGTTVSRRYLADFYLFFEDPFVALLPALQLHEGFARSFSVLDLIGGQTSPDFRRRYELRVTGKRHLKVPAGRFQCWTVELRNAGIPEHGTAPGFPSAPATRLYVDTATGVLVRAIWNQPGGFFREQVLVDRRPDN